MATFLDEAQAKAMCTAVQRAAVVCRVVYQQLHHQPTITSAPSSSSSLSISKADRSPVTIADYAAQIIIISTMHAAFPDIPFVAEEDAGTLRTDETLRTKVSALVRLIFPDMSEDEMMHHLDNGKHPGGMDGSFFCLDPIDGTQGFLRGNHYAICLGLVCEGQVVMGALGCPNLSPKDFKSFDDDAESSGCMFIAKAGEGAYMTPTLRIGASDDVVGSFTRIHSSSTSSFSNASYVESFESRGDNHSMSLALAASVGVVSHPLRMDSQTKYAVTAAGSIDLYIRCVGSDENIWDHAAGYCIVREAGGKVTDLRGHELDFGVGRTLRRNVGVLASNGLLHDEVVRAYLRQQEEQKGGGEGRRDGEEGEGEKE